MAHDADYLNRLELLADLMAASPTSPMRKLRREALKYYPVSSKALERLWMTSDRIAEQAADIANQRVLDELESMPILIN